MDLFTHLLGGFAVALSPALLLYCVAGVLLGILVGILPGIGVFSAIALLLPFAAKLGPTAALILFCGIYCGSKYGGSATAILMNLPADSGSIVTCIDGYAMTKRGRAGAALILCAVGSFVAGMLGLAGLTLLATPLAEMMLRVGPLEYLAIALTGLILFTKATGYDCAKTVLMVLTGVMLGTVGVDVNSSFNRFSFGFAELARGIDLSLIAMGFFGMGEIFTILVSPEREVKPVPRREVLPTREECRRSAAPILRGGLLGFFVGLLPGAAVTISTFASYALEKALGKKSAEFGRGAVEGVVGPEAANNSAIAGTLVSAFALGLPFSGTTAIILSGLLIHGISPGPFFIEQYPEIFWGVVASMYVGNVILLLVNYPFALLFIQLLRVPVGILGPIFLAAILTGTYTLHNSVFDLLLVVGFGVLGFLFKRADYAVAPLIVGVIMGPELERRLIQTLYLYQNDLQDRISHPLTIAVFCIGAVLVFLSLNRFDLQKRLRCNPCSEKNKQ